jgi:hypothetical protein
MIELLADAILLDRVVRIEKRVTQDYILSYLSCKESTRRFRVLG